MLLAIASLVHYPIGFCSLLTIRLRTNNLILALQGVSVLLLTSGCLSSTRCGDVVTMMMHSCLLALTKQAYTSSCLEASLTCQRMRKNGKRFVRMCVTLLEDGNLTFPAPLAILSRIFNRCRIACSLPRAPTGPSYFLLSRCLAC
ncbi:hypothetical protein V6Z96_005271 [Aspergillus fumigatus]